jgi:hypothetical protein
MARERGSVTMWVAGVTMLAMVVAVVVAHVAAAGAAQGRAQGAADLAALAGVDGGRAEAAAVARRNGAEVVGYVEQDGRVDVRVERDGAVAEASAVRGELPLDSLRGVQPP